MELIPIEKCIPRRLYRIGCRNLIYGIWNPETKGFIGIREKFDDLFLFTEYHWDTGAPFGTVNRMRDTGIDLPEEIELKEHFDTIDQKTKRKVKFDGIISKGGRGWIFIDTDEPSKEIRAMSPMNKLLFEWLKQKENELYPNDPDKLSWI